MCLLRLAEIRKAGGEVVRIRDCSHVPHRYPTKRTSATQRRMAEYRNHGVGKKKQSKGLGLLVSWVLLPLVNK